ncbi:MAG TPA: glycine oxidase ThiO [Terriglobales bacterium]
MKSWDAIVIGGGVIGLSVALDLNKRGSKVLLLDRGEPGHEASFAAGGMLAHCDPHTPEPLRHLALLSAAMYREFVHELMDETGIQIDLRPHGTIYFPDAQETVPLGRPLSRAELSDIEPHLVAPGLGYHLPESCVDPRHLVEALRKSLHHRGVDIAAGTAAVNVDVGERKVVAVTTDRSRYPTAMAVNCAGAWAASIGPVRLHTQPVKGQMLCIVPKHGSHFPLQHVVRSKNCYLIPRSDGRLVVGTTVEHAGFDKTVRPDDIQHLHQQASILMPPLGEGRMLEAWAGLRPGTPDGLPLLGETSYNGYLAATGHYRDGILLAPITARIIGELATGRNPEMNLIPFAPERFS